MTNPASQAAALLVTQAWNAYEQGRNREALSAAVRAVEAAGRLDDPVLLVRALSAEAEVLKMTGNDTAALARYTKILGLAQDPATGSRLDRPDAAKVVTSAYCYWVTCARYVTSIPARDLFTMLDEAQRWITSIGHPDWSPSILLERAGVHDWLGEHEAAVATGQAALARMIQHPDAPGYGLTAFRWCLGDFLRRAGRVGEAVTQYEAGLAHPDAAVWDWCRAHGGLAECALAVDDPARAVREARLAVQLAEPLGDEMLAWSLEILAKVCRAAGDLEAGWQAGCRGVDAAARVGGHYRPYGTALVAADIALDRDDLTAAARLLDELDRHAAAIGASTGTTTRADEVASRRSRHAQLAAQRNLSPGALGQGEGVEVVVV